MGYLSPLGPGGADPARRWRHLNLNVDEFSRIPSSSSGGGEVQQGSQSHAPLGIFEQGLTIDRLEERLGWVFDGDPLTHFDRIDRVG